MKSFLNFLSEARTSRISDQAVRQGLTGDGHGIWFDSKGHMVAKTEKGRLSMLSKKVPAQKAEPAQNPKNPAAEEEKLRKDDDLFGSPNQPAVPRATRADGSPKEDRGALTVAFGRFNPPHMGHEKLIKTAKSAAGKGALRIYPSRSQDAKKNPLDADSKSELMKQMFPDHAGSIVNDPNARTIFDVLKQAHDDGYSSVKIVAGGKRVQEFDKLAKDYNGKLYDFSNIETVSAGERDEKKGGVEAISASKQRKAAAENNYDEFVKGLPKKFASDEKASKQLFNTVRKQMKVNEGWNLWEIAPQFDWKNLRENYISGNIFKVDQLVENLHTGLVGKIIRRGTNYLICVTKENVMFKSWITDLTEATYTDVSGVPANQREVGTDALRKYAMRIMGVKDIKNFINKNKKKK